MRPQISKLEASILLEAMRVSKPEIESSLRRYAELERELWVLGNRARVDPYVRIDPHVRFKAKSQEYERLKQELYVLRNRIRGYTLLIQKLSYLASEQIHTGRYRFSVDEYLSALKNGTEKQPKTPIS